MKNYREIKLHGEEGLYNIKIDINDFPGNSIEYFFVVKQMMEEYMELQLIETMNFYQ